MIKIIKQPKSINKLYILFYKKIPSLNHKRTTNKQFDIELSRIKIATFLNNLEKGDYEVPKYSNCLWIWKGQSFNTAQPVGGFINFKRIHNKFKLL